jgi:hypothetical protein
MAGGKKVLLLQLGMVLAISAGRLGLRGEIGV